jgi:thiol:disulfide interchange protein DsbD
MIFKTVLRAMGVAAVLAASLVPAAAQTLVPGGPQHVQASLVTETTSIQPGKPFTVALRLKMDPGWHTYWVNPGEAGLPTTLKWTLPQGYAAGDLQWPAPKRLPAPGAINFGYDNEVLLLTQLTAPANAHGDVTLHAHATWLVCADICIPGEADVTAITRAGAGTPRNDPKWTSAFAATRAAIAAPVADWNFTAESTPKGYNLIATPTRAGAAWPKGEVFFFNRAESVIEPSGQQTFDTDGDRHIVRLVKDPFAKEAAGTLQGDLVAREGWGDGVIAAAVETKVTPGGADAAGGAASTAPAGAGNLLLALAFAFVGGLVLNLMPCVFPVIGIKIVGFVNQAHEDRKVVTLHGLTYTAGVLISFWVLAGLLAALRAGGAELGWGFQLQSAGFNFALAVVMLIFALNLSGVFEIGAGATGVGGALTMKQGLAGTFFTGFLAVVVATPCSAPFLAPALGAALALPVTESFLVFTVIGIGLSAPYLALSAFPSAVKLLPKPGRWMETFKQVMAFPLFATVAYLVWVLAGQVSEETLLNIGFGLVLIAMSVWAWGRWSAPGAKQSQMRFAAAALVLLFAAGAWIGWPRASAANASADVTWEKWSPEAVQALRADNRIIYVDFTARWCATCQANKKLVFHSRDVLDTFAAKKIATLRADWTNQDPQITAELAKYQRNAIPFNLVYLPGEATPKILPEVLTPDIVLKAVGG